MERYVNNYLNSLFVPFEESLILKELGFDEECFVVYINGKFKPRYKSRNSSFKPNQKLDSFKMEYCTAIIWDQVFKWLRDKHNIELIINKVFSVNEFCLLIIHTDNNHDDLIVDEVYPEKSFEDIRLLGLIKILKIIKEKEK